MADLGLPLVGGLELTRREHSPLERVLVQALPQDRFVNRLELAKSDSESSQVLRPGQSENPVKPSTGCADVGSGRKADLFCASLTEGSRVQLINNAHVKKSPKSVIKIVVIVAGLVSLVIPIRVISQQVGEIIAERANAASIADVKPLPPEWVETIDQLKSFVETERGMKFKYKFPVILESKEEFRDRLAAEAEEYDQPEAADSYIALKALNLVDSKLDLNSLEDPLQDGGTIGYYDSVSNRLVVEAEKPTPFVRGVIVHELTHALQDQYFALNRRTGDFDESFIAFESVIEGDAMRIENQYIKSLTPEEQAAAATEEEALSTSEPESESLKVLGMLAGFPYEVGENFVNEVFAFGGQARVDQALRAPPTTTEQVLHSERFLAVERPAKVDSPDAGGDVYEEGVWGEMGLLTMFLQTLPEEQAWEAAEGWGGDYFVAWKKSGKDCIRMDIVTDGRTDKNQLVQALRDWAEKHPSASIKSGKTIQINACS